MNQGNRIQGGVCVDYDQPVSFSFNGRKITGYRGDSIASALLAADIRLVGRSYKYGRPRGIVAAGPEEPNAILQLGKREATQIPNVRATQQEIYEGLVCGSTNGWPNLKYDAKGLLGRLIGRFLPAGFYYKTFMFPAFLWDFYESVIRQAAGLGRAPAKSDPDTYDHLHHHADVLIVGAGPAGLQAAKVVAQSGARVILVDENPQLGGSLLVDQYEIDGSTAIKWVSETEDQLQINDVVILSRTTVVGYHDHNYLVAHERRTDHVSESTLQSSRQRMHLIRASHVIIATGAQERPLVYANNDLPGCMQAYAVKSYIRKFGVVPGKQLILMATNDAAWETAFAWFDAGREVVAIVDSRAAPCADVLEGAVGRGIPVFASSGVIEALGTASVRGARVARLSEGLVEGTVQNLDCDTIASSGGWSPVVHLTCHTGVRPVWRDDIAGFVPGSTTSNQHHVGGIIGEYSLAELFNSAIKTSQEVLADLELPKIEPDVPRVEVPSRSVSDQLYLVPHTKTVSRAPKQFVDFQLDVSAADLHVAALEGFESIEHVKRYTALGFGTDQGKLSNVNGVAIAAETQGKTVAELGTTMFRPNYTPVAFGAIAGRNSGTLFDPIRYTPIQSWHEAQRAEFEDVGQWKRPRYFPKGSESMQEAVSRECLAVRNGLGILDASTLGKIDIQGPDAREFLNRIYTNAWRKLPVGQCRYGIMCGEDGMVIDDGVTAALGENHFLMHTTTGGASRILEWIELWHQTEWPELRVFFNSVTDHWVTASVSGPFARSLLRELTDLPLSNVDFPFMHFRSAEVAGIPARIFRVSFTGELTYEINVQAGFGLQLWQELIATGERFDITPYGTETMHVLRAEKGFIIVGQDSDGSVTPLDLGMEWALAMKKPFSFVGKRGMSRSDCIREDRKQLVGLLPDDPQVLLKEGSQLVNDSQLATPIPMQGHVTSSYFSPTMQRSFALALVKGGRKRMGETLYAAELTGNYPVKICRPVFYDQAGDRQNVE